MADNILARVKGLLGRKEFPAGEALILRPCNSIHTFFMRFPIDLLFMDKNNYVVGVVPALKPARLSKVFLRAACVIELPVGTIQSARTSKGDLLSII
ncbi:MAG: DUF192 domain-containing protein [Candidatus Omnitrophica bacterium]|nr:DUF192 domain-containing protein [Candidatus Omnitrophota bacterium]